MDDESRLDQVAALILEGTPVDWSAVESTASPAEQVVLRQLRVLQDVTALHRQLPQTEDSGPSPVTPSAGAAAMWGHLRLLELVGRGSFGEVYRAWDTHLDREVALKVLRATGADSLDPSATLSDPTRVVHEGRLLARVPHQNVITVYGAEPREGTVGIWMEFIRGTTLHQLVERQGRLGAREAAGIGTDLCHAVAAVHRAGLLHRDISARNVMREEGGRVVLMDFGAGHDELPLSEKGRGITGTPLYMAPELLRGHAASQTTDIYALGALMYHLVTGSYPVSGRSLDEVKRAHTRGERARLRDVRPDLPVDFVRAIEQALHADPIERFQTAGELEAALALIGWNGHRASADHTFRRGITAGAVAAAAIAVALAVALYERDDAGRTGRSPEPQPSAAGLATRRIDPPPEVWPFTNPSDDGRYVAGMVTETGDAAIVDLSTGQFRPLGIGHSQDQGYASLGALSPDGRLAAIDYHNDQGGNLYIVRTDGGGTPRLLLEAPGDVWPYQFSRDGTIILAAIERPGQKRIVGLVAVSDGAVRTLGELSPIAASHMSLSPDNRYVAYDAPEREGANERDIVILDAHTGNSWPLETVPGDDLGPLWTPDGRALVFVSDRNRNPSLWMAPVEQGRLSGPAQMLRDGVGRVSLVGFTASGTLHYILGAGFAEVFLASLDGSQPSRPETLSPRRAVSNFYPVWSTDGRFVAYAAERSDLNASRALRQLWVYDTTSGTESVVAFSEPITRPFGWSSDSREVLVGGALTRGLYAVDRATGGSRVIATEFEGRTAWGPAGILFVRNGQIALVDPRSGRTRREFGPARESNFSADGRSVIAKRLNGRVALVEPASGATREWTDPVEWVGIHSTAPYTGAVAYMAGRKGVNGEVRSLMYWGGSGDPRELLRINDKERFILVGWLPDGLTLIAARSENQVNRQPGEAQLSTLWRIPVAGGSPVSTGLTMDGLRDVSIHPDGRRIAFNAGWRTFERWAMDHVLPQ